jgi:hypothetical protein
LVLLTIFISAFPILISLICCRSCVEGSGIFGGEALSGFDGIFNVGGVVGDAVEIAGVVVVEVEEEGL